MTETPDTEIFLQHKQKHDSDALNELISRHSGIYVDMIKRFGGRSLTDMQKMDLMGEKDYNIYNAALEYKPDKSKFSTYLANKARYLCLSGRTANKKSPHVVDFDSVMPFIEDDGTPPDEQSISRELLQKLSEALDSLTDERAKIIFHERYFSTSNHKLKPWKEIARITGLSTQGCINIHNKFLPELHNQLEYAKTTF